MLFQLKLQSKIGTLKPIPIKKRRPDLIITLKKCANESLGAKFRALSANWDALLWPFFAFFDLVTQRIKWSNFEVNDEVLW